MELQAKSYAIDAEGSNLWQITLVSGNNSLFGL